MISKSAYSLAVMGGGIALVALGLLFRFVLKNHTNYRFFVFLGYILLAAGFMASGYLDTLAFVTFVSVLIVICIGFIVLTVVFIAQERKRIKNMGETPR